MPALTAFWICAALLLFAGAWRVYPANAFTLSPFDANGLALAHAMRSPELDWLMQAVTWAGSLWLLLPLTVLAAAGLARQGRTRQGGFLVLSLLSTSGLSHLVKAIVARPRPDLFPLQAAMPLDWSYPSAHTMQAFALAIAVLLLAGKRAPLLALPLIALAAGVGFSRVYLQVHYPTDVVIGMLAAWLWVLGLHHGMLRKPTTIAS